jgi:hypothetical protein
LALQSTLSGRKSESSVEQVRRSSAMLEGCVFRLPLSIPKHPAAHLVWFLPFEHRCKIQEIGSASYPGYPVEETRALQPPEPDYPSPRLGLRLGEPQLPFSIVLPVCADLCIMDMIGSLCRWLLLSRVVPRATLPHKLQSLLVRD